MRAIHIAERDTQVQDVPKKIGEFVNTWSIDGFIGEGCQPAELGWGTHEKELPPKVRPLLLHCVFFSQLPAWAFGRW